MKRWVPGRDRRAVRHPGQGGRRAVESDRSVVVVGGGIAGVAAAVGLAERGVRVTLVERESQLGGRVRAWPVDDGSGRTMSRGFHAFFRQYYNLRALLRRADPALDRLRPVADYPLQLAGGPTDSFARLPTRPPWNLAGFVLTSPSFPLRALRQVDTDAALELVRTDFPRTFSDYDGQSAANFLDRLRFPDTARHLALDVFARSFFADPREFSAGELVGMFHTYFSGSAEGLLFDVPDDDYHTALWGPLAAHLGRLGVELHLDATVDRIDLAAPGDPVRVTWSDREHTADAVVVAADPRVARELVAGLGDQVDPGWRDRVLRQRNAPPFVVGRLWLGRPVRADRPAFLGTSGYGPLDNVTVLERFERGAAAWAGRTGGSVVEVHAYSVDPDATLDQVRTALLTQLERVYPEVTSAPVVEQEWLSRDDCPLIGTDPWVDRPEAVTPDPRLLLAGDWLRCDYPVALMERAATTGWQAANSLLVGWGVAGHDLWTVPMRGIAAGRRRRSMITDG